MFNDDIYRGLNVEDIQEIRKRELYAALTPEQIRQREHDEEHRGETPIRILQQDTITKGPKLPTLDSIEDHRRREEVTYSHFAVLYNGPPGYHPLKNRYKN